MWTVQYICSQVMVVIAMVFLSITFFVSDKRKILLFVTLSSLFFAIQYLLLGAYAGVLLNFMGIVRNIWIFLDKKANNPKNLYTIFAISIIEIAAIAISSPNWLDLLVLGGTLLFNFGVWDNRLGIYRACSLIVDITFTLYNIFFFSIFGIVENAVLVILDIIANFRYYLYERKKVR